MSTHILVSFINLYELRSQRSQLAAPDPLVLKALRVHRTLISFGAYGRDPPNRDADDVKEPQLALTSQGRYHVGVRLVTGELVVPDVSPW